MVDTGVRGQTKTRICMLYWLLILFYGNASQFFFLATAERGIRLVNEGQYSEAVNLFTEAIKCDPKDYRYHYSTWTINMCHLTSPVLNSTLLFAPVSCQVFCESFILLLLSGAVLSSIR